MAKRPITILGRPCHLVTIRDNTTEIVTDDHGELTEAEWQEYCRMVREELSERAAKRKAHNLAAFRIEATRKGGAS